MRRIPIPLSVAAVVLLGALAPGFAGPTAAQDATPAAGAGEALDPAECRVEPRPADELIAVWYEENEAGTPVLATPAADTAPASVPVPLGEPADAETAAAATAVVREVLACFNAGDFGRALALFSDDLVRSFGPSPEETPEDVRAFLAPAPEPLPAGSRIRLLAVTDVAVMADGRVGAFVVTDDPTVPPEGPETALVLVVEEDGRWLVDAVVEFVVVEEGDGGTPAP